MIQITCCKCAVLFSMTEALHGQRREDHKTFFCPNGHRQYFTGENKAEYFKRMYEGETQSKNFWRGEALLKEDQLVSMRRSRGYYRGLSKRLKTALAHVQFLLGRKMGQTEKREAK